LKQNDQAQILFIKFHAVFTSPVKLKCFTVYKQYFLDIKVYYSLLHRRDINDVQKNKFYKAFQRHTTNITHVPVTNF